jgi:hypothetical protein
MLYSTPKGWIHTVVHVNFQLSRCEHAQSYMGIKKNIYIIYSNRKRPWLSSKKFCVKYSHNCIMLVIASYRRTLASRQKK